jgi:hypothetical protein
MTFGGLTPISLRGDVHYHHHLSSPKKTPIEIKYIEKRSVVQDVNRCGGS